MENIKAATGRPNKIDNTLLSMGLSLRQIIKVPFARYVLTQEYVTPKMTGVINRANIMLLNIGMEMESPFTGSLPVWSNAGK